jgi:hypothetical protein
VQLGLDIHTPFAIHIRNGQGHFLIFWVLLCEEYTALPGLLPLYSSEWLLQEIPRLEPLKHEASFSDGSDNEQCMLYLRASVAPLYAVAQVKTFIVWANGSTTINDNADPQQ